MSLLAVISAYAFFSLLKHSENKKDKVFTIKTAFYEGIKILMLGLLITSMFLVNKTAFDDRHNCEWLETNSTVSANTTVINHAYVCSDNDTNTTPWSLKLPLWIIRILGIFTIIYLIYMVYDYFDWLLGDKRDDD